ncbi:hypothetical protein B0H16DRAFT_1452969 [Mycena metata]|uniref:Uncharacterized protein n=1 Tax=Mycena metata TaxID=1033252 RepID=A0AAD7JQ29_9AGAR|nr:hypothetical protein B0H16DRAFT_1452969 [Mycena metata]
MCCVEWFSVEFLNFATEEIGESIPESEYYYESTTVVREQGKNFYAPLPPDRTFSSFDGQRNNSPNQALQLNSAFSVAPPPVTLPPKPPVRRAHKRQRDPSSDAYGDELPESPIKEKLGISDARKGKERRSSRSLSPRRPAERSKARYRSRSLQSDRSEGESGDEESDNDTRNRRNIPRVEPEDDPLYFIATPSQTWAAGFQTQEEAIRAIARITPRVTELIPAVPAYKNLAWNSEWLKSAVIVCENPHSLIRLKIFAALLDSARFVEDVLELALWFSIEFQLYIKASSYRAPFGDQISSTLGA